jgi:hypothetical protein
MPASSLRVRPMLGRVLVAGLAALTLVLTAAGPMLAVEPIDVRDARSAPRPTVVPQPPVRPDGPAPVRAPAPSEEPMGYDISWPQCNDEPPERIGFAIVGVNGGRVYKANPCLAAQLEWAGQDADLYVNTGNPGPRQSRFWPSGQAGPRHCDTPRTPGTETPDCAYLYGWNAAADSYQTALDAFVELGWADPQDGELPGERTWWLDVETANSWQRDRRLNVAALRGAVDFLESTGAEVGFYSTPLMWWRVTFGTDAFADYPAWHAGARSRAEAVERCEHDAFTGGELRFVQWVEDGIDTNLRCP